MQYMWRVHMNFGGINKKASENKLVSLQENALDSRKATPSSKAGNAVVVPSCLRRIGTRSNGTWSWLSSCFGSHRQRLDVDPVPSAARTERLRLRRFFEEEIDPRLEIPSWHCSQRATSLLLVFGFAWIVVVWPKVLFVSFDLVLVVPNKQRRRPNKSSLCQWMYFVLTS